MIPKVEVKPEKLVKGKPEKLSDQMLGKKRITFTTLQKILDRSGANQEFTKKIMNDIEDHIRLKNEKRVHNRIRTKSTELVNAFEAHYARRYAKTSIRHHVFNIGKWVGYLHQTFPEIRLQTINDCNKITKSMVNSYQEYLVSCMHLGKIEKSTLNRYLYSLKMFLDMLSSLRINHIRYTIDPSLRGQAKRANEYVQVDEIAALIEHIEESKNKMKLRDMSVILIIMELGCRPIEVANLQLDDIRLTDRLITLRSVKSKTRTLQMSKDLVEIIKKYIESTRSPFNCDHNALFVNRKGSPLESHSISTMFKEKNYKCFNEIRFTPKSLRHTYATNALDNLNDFDQVSESLGHKHRRSTEWYIHRSVQRLLSRTLPFNPLDHVEEE